ncbi:MAG: hypothetical protein IKO62_10000 [Bacteroidales bacterium]|nr:hypothetical protein [Bacteroidales bacterium]
MSKQEKVFWFLAYAATAVLTLLPFFHVGFTTSDDFQYFNTAQQNWDYWMMDAEAYAHGAGRFYFLITKIFYYVPYLFDSFAWAKFVQYSSLLACYLLFTYLVIRIFKSQRLGALTLLLLIFNTAIDSGRFCPPTAFNFYFHFSFLLFLLGVLLFLNYTERKGYWRVIVSSLLFFATYLFYETYLIFAILFCSYILIRNWEQSGFANMLKDKKFYQEIIPYFLVSVIYVGCYVGYRHYLMRTIPDYHLYDGAALSANFSLSHFFLILKNCTLYTLPGRIYDLDAAMVAQNSLFISGHYDNLFFILTHASAVAYISALIQCGILWFLILKNDFQKLSWKTILLGILVALAFAFSAHTLVAMADKYNASWYSSMQAYVTTFYSYFGMMLVIALVIWASLKAISSATIRKIIAIVWCVLLFGFSIVNTYTNEHLSRAWERSQNRITVIQLMAQDGFFEKIPEGALIYTEALHHTSDLGFSICDNTYDFEKNINWRAGKNFSFSQDLQTLFNDLTSKQEAPLYFIQAVASQKNNELLLVFSHIYQIDSTNILKSLADDADIFYYSPTKNYTLFYTLGFQTDSVRINSINVSNSNPHQKLTHVHLQEQGMSPFNFNISNLLTPSTDTLVISSKK